MNETPSTGYTRKGDIDDDDYSSNRGNKKEVSFGLLPNYTTASEDCTDYVAMSDDEFADDQSAHPSAQGVLQRHPLSQAIKSTGKDDFSLFEKDSFADRPVLNEVDHSREGTNALSSSPPSDTANASMVTSVEGNEHAAITDNEVTDDGDFSSSNFKRINDIKGPRKKRLLLSQTILSSIQGDANFKDADELNVSTDEQLGRLEQLSDILRELAIHDQSANKDESKEILNNAEELIQADMTASMNWSEIDSVLETLIEREFPHNNRQIPNLREVINVGKLDVPRFSPGAWVEIRGADMEWRLDMITKVSKEAPPDYDWNCPKNKGKEPEWIYYYQAGDERRLKDEDLRSPKEGLLRIFGSRPWIWQQWACLKLEQILRFQEGHQHDFQLLDVQRYATELWEHWLEHPKNKEFHDHFFDDRIGDFGRSELVDHIMTPFRLMDRIANDESDWNFEEDPDISIYTYLSLFGSGFLVPAVIVFVQISVMLILYYSASHDRSWDGSYQNEDDQQEFFILAMAIVVMILYLVKVVPDIFVRFYHTVGTSDTIYFRLCSLRKRSWLRHKDRPGQKIGYRLDLFMNTSYVAILYVFNVYIIINAEGPLDVILNSLALEFVDRLDEAITHSLWWDRKKRWIRAGAIEVAIQDTLRKESLKSSAAFSRDFNIPENVVSDFCDYNPLLFCDRDVAKTDADDQRFKTKTELIKLRCKEIALKNGNSRALQEYQKQVVFFGSSEKFFHQFCSFGHDGLFQRNLKYQTWSRWDKVLYYSPVPDLDFLFEKNENGEPTLRKNLENIVHSKLNPFVNFDESVGNDARSFAKKYIEVVFFIDFLRQMKICLQEGQYKWLLFHAFDGILQWFRYIMQLNFLLYVVWILLTILDYLDEEYTKTITTIKSNISSYSN